VRHESNAVSLAAKFAVRGRALALAAGFALAAPGPIVTTVWAQNRTDAPAYSMGFMHSDPALALQWPGATLHRGFLPARIDLSASLPPPGNQKDIGSCTAWATAYGAASYYARLQLKAADIKLSPAFVFNQVKHDPKEICGGANLREVINFVAERGAPRADEYPESRFCEPANTAASAAKPIFHATNIRTLAVAQYADDGRRDVKVPFDVDVVRQELANGNPIIIGMRTTEDLLPKLPAGAIYDYHTAADPGYRHGGHAILIIGYDDEMQAFRVMNSWGEDWGDRGFFWISYGSAVSEIEEAYVMEGEVAPPRPSPAPHLDPPPVQVDPGKTPVANANACSALFWVRSTQGVKLLGFVENEGDRAAILKQWPALASKIGVSSGQLLPPQILVAPWPQCEALLTTETMSAVSDSPTLATLDGKETYSIGQTFGFKLETPNFPAFVYLIYLQADGQAVNLLPRLGPIRQQLPPRTIMRIGETGGPGPHFRAADPPGYEAVIAISARSPIAELEELEQKGGRYYKTGFDGRPGAAAAAEDRRVLSAIRDALLTRPVPGAPPREISATALLLRIGG
jgi:hypothetical protein